MRKTTKSGKNARTTAPTKAKADLMLDARNAADEYAQIRVEFTASNEGYRSRVYKFAANCYSIGLGFMENQAAYKRFMADPFWKTVRQVPKDGDIMKAVLTFAMKPKSTTLRNRVLKTATVLSRLAKEKVVASAVVDRFKTGGGIEKMYSRIYPNSTFPTLVADVLGLLSETPSEDVADLQPAPKEDTDEWPVSIEPDDNDDSKKDGNAGPASVEMRATKDQSAIGSRNSKGRTFAEHFNSERDLVIDLSETDQSPATVWSMGRIYITAIVGPQEADGWRPMIATRVVRQPRTVK